MGTTIDAAGWPRRGEEGPAVVALGGGHGLSATLRALRHVTHRLTAVVTVADDGVGAGGVPEGTGLTGMRSRVETLGGTLTVDPLQEPAEPGRVGTVVEARMPL